MYQIGSWGFSKTRPVRGIHKKKLDLTEISKRLERTQIECQDALKIIKSRDSKDTFFYIDPPYLNADQGHYSGFNEMDMEELLKLLSTIKGKFLLSNYDHSPILRTG